MQADQASEFETDVGCVRGRPIKTILEGHVCSAVRSSRASAYGRAEHYLPSHLVTLEWLTADGCARSTLEGSSGGRA